MNKSQTMKNSQTVSPNTTSVQGPANLASLTFFSNRRSLFFISLLYFSDSLLICSMRTLTGSFGWLSLIASLILSIPFTLLFGKIFRSAGVGKIFLFLSKIVAVALIAASVLLFSHFVQSCVNMEITRWLLPVFILLTAAFAAFKDFNIIKRSASILVIIIAFFRIFSLILLTDRIEISNVFHFYHGFRSFLFQFGIYSLLFTVKGILLLEILRAENTMDSDSSRIVITGLAASVLLIAVIQLITLTVLGDRLYSLIEYPVYYPLGLTRYGDYFERAEVISLAVFMITLTFKISVLMRLVFPSTGKKQQDRSGSKAGGGQSG